MGQHRRTPITPDAAEPVGRATPGRRARAAAVRLTPEQRRVFQRLPPATRLSPEGSREVLEEIANPPADTPERRALFKIVRRAEALLAEMECAEHASRRAR